MLRRLLLHKGLTERPPLPQFYQMSSEPFHTPTIQACSASSFPTGRMVTGVRQFVILSIEKFCLFRVGWSHEAALLPCDSWVAGSTPHLVIIESNGHA
jgi:hypothetical protein